jgi:hypothetical protein
VRQRSSDESICEDRKRPKPQQPEESRTSEDCTIARSVDNWEKAPLQRGEDPKYQGGEGPIGRLRAILEQLGKETDTFNGKLAQAGTNRANMAILPSSNLTASKVVFRVDKECWGADVVQCSLFPQQLGIGSNERLSGWKIVV